MRQREYFGWVASGIKKTTTTDNKNNNKNFINLHVHERKRANARELKIDLNHSRIAGLMLLVFRYWDR